MYLMGLKSVRDGDPREGALLLPSPSPDGAFAFSFGNRFDGWVAECQKYGFRLVSSFASQMGQGRPKFFQPEIIRTIRPFRAVQKRGKFDEFMARIEKVQVEDLLPGHKVLTLNIRRKSAGARHRGAAKVGRRKNKGGATRVAPPSPNPPSKRESSNPNQFVSLSVQS
jgi:hypothetical protein